MGTELKQMTREEYIEYRYQQSLIAVARREGIELIEEWPRPKLATSEGKVVGLRVERGDKERSRDSSEL